MSFIEEIENQLQIEAKKQMMPMQPGDVSKTWADIEELKTAFNYTPTTSIKNGVKKFIDWYKNYYL